MKKNVFYLIAILLIFSCTKNENDSLDVNIYDLTASLNLEGLNTSKVERIGKDNPIATNYIEELSSHGVNVSSLNLDQIHRFTLAQNDVFVFSVSLKNSTSTVMSYEYDGEYIVLESIIDDNNCTIKTLDGNLFANINIKEKVFIETYRNGMMEDFNNCAYEKNISDIVDDSNVKAECCRKEEGFRYCVNCTYNNNWFLFVLQSRYIPQLTLAVMASCIGAGPNSWC